MEASMIWIVIGASILTGISFFAGFIFCSRSSASKIRQAETLAKRLVENAEKQSDAKKKEVELELKENWYKSKAALEEEIKERRLELRKLERRIQQKEENLDKKTEVIDRQEKALSKREKKVQEQEARINHLDAKYRSLIEEELRKLEKISGMSQDDAKKELMEKVIEEAKLKAAEDLRRIEQETRESAERRAREIISYAIQSCASDHVAETTVSVVDLPNEEMKGRIIGREGRNIRALQMATGVDLIIDDTPEAVILSGFDPVKREITRIALGRLIADGRIHPGRIEEIVAKVAKEMSVSLREEGERAAFESGVDGLHPELIRMLGILKYRTSYSQNLLQHSKEVAYLCGVMAAELGLNVKMAKRAGLLHDIGKAVDHQIEGTHAKIGADILRRLNELELVVMAVEAHHEEVEAKSCEAVLLQAADAISAARPGARREMLETYIKRLEKLEEICDSFKGVQKAYAIQAGREIRVIVEPQQVNDDQATILARDIAKKIEAELTYPGEIRVTVIREVRAVEHAK